MIQSTIFYFRWTITESSYMTTWLSMRCFLDKYCNNWNSHFPVWYKTCFPIFSKTYCSVYYETSTKEAILLVDMRVENEIFLSVGFLFLWVSYFWGGLVRASFPSNLLFHDCVDLCGEHLAPDCKQGPRREERLREEELGKERVLFIH